MMVEICLSSMHPTTLLPARSHGNPDIFYEVANSALLPDVTERCYQVNIIYQISLYLNRFFSPLTYSPVKLLFDGFVPRTNDQNEYESDAHLKSAYRTYNMLCISDVLKCIFPILLIIFQWGKTLNIFLFPFALRLFFLPNGGQFYLFYVKCT